MSKAYACVRPRAWWLAATLLVTPALAQAEEDAKPYPECTRTASDSDVTAAKAAFQAGNVSFNEADYPRAILYWEDAYRRDCTKHQMLLNLARAYELNGQKKAAVMALETFITREPNAPDKPQITRRIDVLKKQIDNEQAAAAAPEPVVTPEPEPAPEPQQAPPEQVAPAEDSGGSRPILPLVVAGVGGVMFIGGGVLYIVSSNKVEEYASHCGDPDNRTDCPANEVSAANAARTRQTIGGVVAGVGVPVLVGGLVWYFVSPRERGSASVGQRRTAVLPAVSREFTGLSLSGSF